jgi:hypothetical protein
MPESFLLRGLHPAGIANFGHEKNWIIKGFLEFARESGFERSAERNGIKADTWRSDDPADARAAVNPEGQRTGFRRWKSGAVPAPSQPGCKPAVSDRVGAAERAQVEKNAVRRRLLIRFLRPLFENGARP